MQEKRYGLIASNLHWITAIAIIVLFALGWTMEPLELSPSKLKYYAWHKWLGLFVLVITLFRLPWRTKNAPPVSTASLPHIMTNFAKFGHAAIYFALIALPLSGWLRSSTAGIEIVIFEKFHVPSLMEKNEEISAIFEIIHWGLGWLLLALIVGHILAIPLHHIRWGDRILPRLRGTHIYLALIAISLALATGFYVKNQPMMAETSGEVKQTIEKRQSKEKPADVEFRKSEWQLDHLNSKLKFTAFQKNAGTEGEFKSFSLNLQFDPNLPAEASVNVAIDMKSMTMFNDLADDALHSSIWFGTEQFPTASFRAKGFSKNKNGDNLYEVNGRLTIRDVTKDIKLPIKITITKDKLDKQIQRLNATGEVDINRLDFGLGTGEWESIDILQNKVTIAINISASLSEAASSPNGR